ncbi:MAG: NAD(+) synthase [Candidatus Woesearchaeota archaeon]|nr:MAG: NAD(+) synthase [Candidatus Woesearchaeota archaeon]
MENLPSQNIKEITNECVDFIRTRTEELGAKGIIVSLSGGIDSATTLYLCKDALGPKKVYALLMPCHIWSDEDPSDEDSLITLESETEDGLLTARTAGVGYSLIDISNEVSQYIDKFSFGRENSVLKKKADGFLVQRARCIIQNYYADQIEYITAGTDNYTEWAYGFVQGTGFATIYPTGAMFKSVLFDVAKHLGVPDKIIKKAPHSGFVGDSTDEKIYGATIRQLDDLYYMYMWHEKSPKEMSEITKLPLAKVKDLIKNIKIGHKLSGYDPSWPQLEIHSQFPHLEEILGGPFKPYRSEFKEALGQIHS